ncbi:unnamed protein product [Prunus armeniaca]
MGDGASITGREVGFRSRFPQKVTNCYALFGRVNFDKGVLDLQQGEKVVDLRYGGIL